jgi:hypothetical protein
MYDLLLEFAVHMKKIVGLVMVVKWGVQRYYLEERK